MELTMSSESLRNKKSAVWLHFDSTNETNKVKCKICRNVFSYKGSAISNLRKHLKVKHPLLCNDVFNTEAGPSKQTNYAEADDNFADIDNSSQFSIPSVRTVSPSSVTSSADDLLDMDTRSQNSSTRTEETSVPIPTKKRKLQQVSLDYFSKKTTPLNKRIFYNNLILNLIIKDLQPFSIVDDVGFRELIRGFDPNYILPSRTTLSRSLLTEKFNEVREKVKLSMQNVSHITLTTDTWTSIATENYMSITAHFIDTSKNWELCCTLIDCFTFPERHTSDNLKEEILRVLGEWEISEKVHTIVTDNAYNITNAVKLTNLNHLPCLAHTLNLIVQNGLRKIEIIQVKVKAIVEYFHRSTVAAEKLKFFQTQINENSNNLKLINDVRTRWNSTHDMFERICLIQEPVVAALGVLHNPVQPLTAGEWAILRELCLILKPFKQISVELSADKVITSSKIIPLVHGLEECVRRGNTDSPIATDLKNSLLDGIATRFSRYEHNSILAFATYLDPRFGKNAFSDPSALEKIKNKISNEMARLDEVQPLSSRSSDIVSPPDNSMDSIWHYIDKKNAGIKKTPLSDSLIEFRKYNEEPTIGRQENVLIWWKSRELIYPRLARLAEKYLGIVATSVPSERVFSKTGQIVSDRRSRLKSEKVQKIVFLNGNQTFV